MVCVLRELCAETSSPEFREMPCLPHTEVVRHALAARLSGSLEHTSQAVCKRHLALVRLASGTVRTFPLSHPLLADVLDVDRL